MSRSLRAGLAPIRMTTHLWRLQCSIVLHDRRVLAPPCFVFTPVRSNTLISKFEVGSVSESSGAVSWVVSAAPLCLSPGSPGCPIPCIRAIRPIRPTLHNTQQSKWCSNWRWLIYVIMWYKIWFATAYIIHLSTFHSASQMLRNPLADLNRSFFNSSLPWTK